MIPNHIMFALKISNFKIIFVLSIFENVVAFKVSLSLFSLPYHDKLPSERHYILLITPKMFKLLALLVYRIMAPMGPCEFTPVRLSIFRPDPPLQTSVTLLELSRGN